MGFIVIADTPADFDRWLARRTGAGTGPTSEQAAAGQRVFMREACAGCHTIRRTEATGTLGPDLSDFGSRQWIGSVTVPQHPGQPGRLDQRLADDQAGQPHAARSASTRTSSTPSSPTWRASSDPRRRPSRRPPSGEDLATLWEDAPGIPGFFSTVDHKRIGMRYIYTSFVFFFLAGLTALLMRAQLAAPESDVRRAPALQRADDHARHDDDLPVQHAGAGRVRQLPDPAAARAPATWRSPG